MPEVLHPFVARVGAQLNRRVVGGSLAPRVVLAGLSGAFCRAAIDPDAPWPALFFSWSLLILAVEELSWRRAAALGLLQGLVANALGFYWLYGGVRDVLSFTALEALLVSGGLILSLAVRSAIIAACHRAASARGFRFLFVFPTVIVAVELVYPAVFPWYTGHFALSLRIWSQLAELGGPLALSFWVALVNAGLAQAWLGRHAWKAIGPPLLVTILTLAIVCLQGHLALSSLGPRIASAEVARVGVVQGNLRPARLETRDPVAVYRGASIELVRRNPNLDLLVWPETAIYSRVPARELYTFARESIWRASRPTDMDLNVPLVTGMSLELASAGCPTPPCPRGGEFPSTNSAVLMSSRGRILGQYDKRTLMPFGESSILPRFLRAKASAPEKYRAGTSDAALLLAGHRLGVSICYEDILHRSFRDAVAISKPDLLLNLTSDSWFQRSAASGLHLSLARLRAVEHRRFMLRATTTGVTSLISPTGAVVWELPADELSSGVVSVPWLQSATVYERVGDWPWLASIPALVVLCFVGRERIARQTGFRRALRRAWAVGPHQSS